MAQTKVCPFSYGTPQQEKVRLETFGRRLEGGPDALPGYRRDVVRITDCGSSPPAAPITRTARSARQMNFSSRAMG